MAFRVSMLVSLLVSYSVTFLDPVAEHVASFRWANRYEIEFAGWVGTDLAGLN